MSNKMQAAFMVAPMAIALRAQGVPIKIVYLGHRYGSAVVCGRTDRCNRSRTCGANVAIPSRFSDERLIVFRAMKVNGMTAKDMHMVEMAPPDVAGALAAKAIDAFSMGEPYPSQAEMAGFGRVLFHAREYWPDYMSCVLVVRQDVIDKRPEAVQTLVDGIARSGRWSGRTSPPQPDEHRQDDALCVPGNHGDHHRDERPLRADREIDVPGDEQRHRPAGDQDRRAVQKDDLGVRDRHERRVGEPESDEERDGYTLLMASTGALMAASAALALDGKFDVAKFFAPITVVAAPPYLLVINPNVKANSVQN